MAETHLENVHNAIVGSTVTTEGGDVLVNGHKVTNYFYSSQYQDLKTQADELQEHFDKTLDKTKKYPDDEDFKADLLKLSGKRNEIRKKLKELKQEVIRLAETFTNIPINSERLKLARQHFEAGNFSAARAILDADAEQMGNELDALLHREEHLQQQQAQVQALRLDKANEFLILARLTALNFDVPDRFDKTIEYFEQSLKATHTLENTFEYAYFLHTHNQFNTAQPWYEESLAIHRRLAGANPDTYLPDVAMTLNNLGNLYRDRHDVAAAQAAYDEAFHIYRRLAAANPDTYLPKVATTLNNLGNLYSDRHDVAAAQAAYDEALHIRRRLADANPDTYLPDLAMTLNNLAVLYSDRHDLAAAQAAYDEALDIRRRLARTNPETYLPKFSGTAVNLSIFYLQNLPDRDKSLAHAGEALAAAWPFVEVLPACLEHARAILQIVEAWGVDAEAFFEETLKTTETN
ncbi:tetratricopeptide repeat protein [Candidatus Nomurabacteria bacterium]|nr:tetratricopeptide repeat protein [Candidatus Nomurabacteria bacterium]